MSNKIKDALTTLVLPSDATLADVKSAYRSAAMVAHPDRGGDPAHFDKLTKARDVLAAHLEMVEKTCPACQGSGRMTVKAFGGNVGLNCKQCKGTGEL
jgi:DnaJ-class molecular chaperone